MHFFYPPSLPISGCLDRLKSLISEHQVVIVAGETGSGKTTQLPKICLEIFAEKPGLIGCTQPRRIAATSVAARVAEEMEADHGVVGSKIRFQDRTGAATRIKFMTDGVLLAETRNDPLLNQYQVIIVDEAHERNLNIDFLLGYLYTLVQKRADLKLIITSATIDTRAFSDHFDKAPVITIEGRTYPVEITYEPLPEDDDQGSYLEHCIEAIASTCATRPPGDMLVFLPTEKDIRSCCEVLNGRLKSHTILPLFGRLQTRDQQRIFASYHKPKIVVATNVAETSVTVPGIRYVIDSGLARIGTYHPRSRTMRLPIERVSRASCNQRSGRSGRVGPGYCIRLYSEEDYLDRIEFTLPEIQRSNLAEVILQMIALDLGDPDDFPFLDPPRRASITEGFRTLMELGAINEERRLTGYGKIMARLPIDPVISRIIIEARSFDCLTEIVIIAAALAIQDPRVRPAEKQQQADESHQRFSDPNSDFIALLNIWKTYHKENPGFSWSALKKFCKNHYLSFQRMREWLDLEEQLRRLVRRQKRFNFNSEPAAYEAIHRSLLAGLFRQCARRKKGSLYQGLGNRELRIFPGSYQAGRSGDWIIGGTFIETTQLFILSAATIEADWLEKSARKFCSYSWTNIRYQKKTGRVMADETVALQGLIIANARLVNYPLRNKNNIPPAREIFIRSALVDDQLSGRFDFHTHNRALLQKWQESEDKLRRRDIVIDGEALFAFYDRYLPADVYDRSTLITHIKKSNDRSLFLSEKDILLKLPGEKDLLDFPTVLPKTDGSVKLSYTFDPGSKNDGVTARIPEQYLETVDPELFDWLVPGLVLEKTTYLFKGLPKRLRKLLIPINDTAALILDSLDMYKGNYLHQLSAEIFKRFRVMIRREDWPEDLPNHLRMHYAVVDRDGKELLTSDNFQALLKRTSGMPDGAARISSEDQALLDRLDNTYFDGLDFTNYPERIPVYLKNGRIGGYRFRAIEPVLQRQAVKISYCEGKDEAERRSSSGFAYLLRLQFKPQFKELLKYAKLSFSAPSAQWLLSTYNSQSALREAVLDFVVRAAVGGTFSPIQNEETFTSHVDLMKNQNLYDFGRNIIDTNLALLRQRSEILEMINRFEQLSKKSGSRNRELYDDLRQQLAELVPADFLLRFSAENLDNSSRCLKSLSIRCERAYHNPQKDMQKRTTIDPYQKNVERYQASEVNLSPECRKRFAAFKAMLNEFRISLFSPEIKTVIPVSEKKIRLAWKDFSAGC